MNQDNDNNNNNNNKHILCCFCHCLNEQQWVENLTNHHPFNKVTINDDTQKHKHTHMHTHTNYNYNDNQQTKQKQIQNNDSTHIKYNQNIPKIIENNNQQIDNLKKNKKITNIIMPTNTEKKQMQNQNQTYTNDVMTHKNEKKNNYNKHQFYFINKNKKNKNKNENHVENIDSIQQQKETKEDANMNNCLKYEQIQSPVSDFGYVSPSVNKNKNLNLNLSLNTAANNNHSRNNTTQTQTQTQTDSYEKGYPANTGYVGIHTHTHTQTDTDSLQTADLSHILLSQQQTQPQPQNQHESLKHNTQNSSESSGLGVVFFDKSDLPNFDAVNLQSARDTMNESENSKDTKHVTNFSFNIPQNMNRDIVHIS